MSFSNIDSIEYILDVYCNEIPTQLPFFKQTEKFFVENIFFYQWGETSLAKIEKKRGFPTN